MAGVRPPDEGGEASLQPGMLLHLGPPASQKLPDQLGGLILLKGALRLPVKLVAQGLEFRVPARHLDLPLFHNCLILSAFFSIMP